MIFGCVTRPAIPEADEAHDEATPGQRVAAEAATSPLAPLLRNWPVLVLLALGAFFALVAWWQFRR